MLLYVLLTGRQPFSSPKTDDPMIVMRRIVDENWQIKYPPYLSPAAKVPPNPHPSLVWKSVSYLLLHCANGRPISMAALCHPGLAPSLLISSHEQTLVTYVWRPSGMCLAAKLVPNAHLLVSWCGETVVYTPSLAYGHVAYTMFVKGVVIFNDAWCGSEPHSLLKAGDNWGHALYACLPQLLCGHATMIACLQGSAGFVHVGLYWCELGSGCVDRTWCQGC